MPVDARGLFADRVSQLPAAHAFILVDGAAKFTDGAGECLDENSAAVFMHLVVQNDHCFVLF
jgi:hypothetical protein